VTDDERQELKDQLLMVQIDRTRLDIDRVRQEMRWEPWKALAGILAACAAMVGVILALSHVIH
jgi:hypothetical protein